MSAGWPRSEGAGRAAGDMPGGLPPPRSSLDDASRGSVVSLCYIPHRWTIAPPSPRSPNAPRRAPPTKPSSTCSRPSRRRSGSAGTTGWPRRSRSSAMASPPLSLTTLLARLAASGTEFVLVGGLAAVAQGAPLTTIDVDVVHRRDPANVERLLAFLGTIDARYRGRPAGEGLRPSRGAPLGDGHQLLVTALGPLDVLVPSRAAGDSR